MWTNPQFPELVSFTKEILNGKLLFFRAVKTAHSKFFNLYTFFISKSIFHLILRLLREDVNFKLKVAKK